MVSRPLHREGGLHSSPVFVTPSPLLTVRALKHFAKIRERSPREMESHSVSSETLDVLTASASELQEKLTKGILTSQQLVAVYLKQIEKHNHHGLHLNAVIALAPTEQLQAQARKLDEERHAGKVRGPLHGIPLLVKDNIMTEANLGMDTTCGSVALKGVKVKKNTVVVDLYLMAGMIILGKANLSVRLMIF